MLRRSVPAIATAALLLITSCSDDSSDGDLVVEDVPSPADQEPRDDLAPEGGADPGAVDAPDEPSATEDDPTSSGSSDDATPSDTPGTSSSEDDATASPTPQATEPEDDAPPEPETPSPPPPPGPDGVLAVGSPAPVDTYTVTVDEVVVDGTSVVLGADPANPAPPAGSQYVVVRLSGTYSGGEPTDPLLDLAVRFRSADGTVHDAAGAGDDACPYDSLYSIGEIAPGGGFEGHTCLTVPTAEVQGGVVVVQPLSGEAATAWQPA